MKEYDENEAIKAMRKALPADRSESYNDDELLNLIDIIWDYYEQNGLLDIDFADDDPDDDPEALIRDITDYAVRMIRKDKKATLATEYIEPLIRAEIDYEDSLLLEAD